MLDTKTSCMQASARERETDPVCIDKLDPLVEFTCSKLTSSRCSMNLDMKRIRNDSKYKTKYSLLFDNVQTLVYAGPGPLYAANFVISPLVGGLLPPVPPLLHLPGLLWFRPLRLLCKDVRGKDGREWNG